MANIQNPSVEGLDDDSARFRPPVDFEYDQDVCTYFRTQFRGDAALAVIDVQEDFCPPNGALAVKDGREIVPVINKLLKEGAFVLKLATKDCHPPNHCSFASQHPGAEPFVTKFIVNNPDAAPGTQIEQEEITLWPDHCIKGTPGCEFLPELDTARIQQVIHKGGDRRVESLSGFGPPFRQPEVQINRFDEILRVSGIKRLFVCGLALDYCVKWTAIDAAQAGYETYVIEDATKAVDQSEGGLKAIKSEMEEQGVRIVQSDSVIF